MSEKTYPHVLIIGAGVTGLSLAQSLKKAGISHEIFEKSSPESYHRRSRDWGITLHWGSYLLPKCFPEEILSNLQTAQVNQWRNCTDSEFVSMINTATGEYIKSIPIGRAGRFSHRKLLTLLGTGIDIQFHKHVDSIVPSRGSRSIVVGFKDGSSAEGDLVIGADGSHSFVRTCLLGNRDAELHRPLGLVVNNFVAQYEASQSQFIMSKLHQFLDMGVNPNGTFFALVPLDVPDPNNLQTVKFQIFISFTADQREERAVDSSARRLEILKEKTKEFVEPFRSAIQWLPLDQIITTEHLYGLDIQSWSTRELEGRVTLAGDAAHPFPPHRGQGLNNALQDVSNITEACLKVQQKDGTLTDLINHYDSELIDRGKTEMQLSIQQSKMMHSWDDLMQSPLMTIGAKRLIPTESG